MDDWLIRILASHLREREMLLALLCLLPMVMPFTLCVFVCLAGFAVDPVSEVLRGALVGWTVGVSCGVGVGSVSSGVLLCALCWYTTVCCHITIRAVVSLDVVGKVTLGSGALFSRISVRRWEDVERIFQKRVSKCFAPPFFA